VLPNCDSADPENVTAAQIKQRDALVAMLATLGDERARADVHVSGLSAIAFF
jgi:hypothetical protein